MSTAGGAVLYWGELVVTRVSQQDFPRPTGRDPCHEPAARFAAARVAVDNCLRTTERTGDRMGRVTTDQGWTVVTDGEQARGRAVAVTAARSAIAKRAMAVTVGRALAAHVADERVCV